MSEKRIVHNTIKKINFTINQDAMLAYVDFSSGFISSSQLNCLPKSYSGFFIKFMFSSFINKIP